MEEKLITFCEYLTRKSIHFTLSDPHLEWSTSFLTKYVPIPKKNSGEIHVGVYLVTGQGSYDYMGNVVFGKTGVVDFTPELQELLSTYILT